MDWQFAQIVTMPVQNYGAIEPFPKVDILMDILDVAIGIFFFLIWIVSGIFSKDIKKKTAAPPTTENKIPAGERESHPGLFDEFKRSIRTVVEEIQKTQKPEVVISEMPTTAVYKQHDDPVVETPMKTGAISKKTSLPDSLKKNSLSSFRQTENVTEKNGISNEHLREMIIWSEILSPPLALRDRPMENAF